MLTSNPYDPADGERRGGTVGSALPGVDVRVVDGDGRACSAGGTIGDDRGARPERVRRLLAHAREDARGVHRRRLVPHRRRRRHRRPTATSPSSAAPRTSSSAAATTSIRTRSRASATSCPACRDRAVVGVPHPDFGEAVVAVVVPRAGATRRAERADRARCKAQDRQLQGAEARSSSSPSCRATRWARCRRTCCASSTRRCSPERRRSSRPRRPAMKKGRRSRAGLLDARRRGQRSCA